VPVVAIDDELKRIGTSKVDFIKMDVEGAEIEAVKGARQTLESNDVAIAAASYHLVNGVKSCHELEKALEALGYKAETGHPQHLTTYARRRTFIYK
jgi:hypothetical protein